MGKLDGKVAWISGATKGIGKGTAKLFAVEGASVAVIGRSEKDGVQIVKEIEETGGKALFYKCDVTKPDQIKSSIEATVSAFGGLDILINNAGSCAVKELHEVGEQEWDDLMNLNVKSMFLAFKYAFPYLKKAKRSYVVNVGSISSFVGQDRTPVYTTSKGAVLNLSKSIGLDYARYGIRCNCVCPGITDTPLLRFHLGYSGEVEQRLKMRLNRVPLAVSLYPEDVAKTILFFSCEDSAGVTATSIIVDGVYLAAAEWDNSIF